MVTRTEKVVIGIWIALLIWWITLVPLPRLGQLNGPVHNVNNCCSADECKIQHHHEKAAKTPLTDSQLEIWYDGLNEDYFLGQLPKADVKWGDLTKPSYVGLTTLSYSGLFEITVDRSTNTTSAEAELTVAHEACHIKTWYVHELSHGPKFQNCMVNLANHGAFEGLW